MGFQLEQHKAEYVDHRGRSSQGNGGTGFAPGPNRVGSPYEVLNEVGPFN